MSPRSAEFMAEAWQRLEAARALVRRAIFGAAVSEAYYAALYAARAALSERDRNAKTHRGTWNLFREELVADGPFDPDLARAATRMQEVREGADYAAATVSREDAELMLGVAERFVEAVAGLIED